MGNAVEKGNEDMRGKREEKRPDKLRGVKAYLPLLWFPAVIFFQELVVRTWAFGSPFGRWVGLVFLFSGALGAVCSFLCCLWGATGNRVASCVLSCLLTFWFGVQTVYFTIFRTFMTVYSIGGAGKIWTFWRDILDGIKEAWLPLLLLLAPTVLLFVFGRRFTPWERAGGKVLLAVAVCGAVFQLSGAVAANASTSGALPPRYLYREEFVPDASVEVFGVMTTLRLDLAQLMGLYGWGGPAAEAPTPTPRPTLTPAPTAGPTPGPDATPEITPEPTPTPIVYQPQVMEIDFNALAEGETNNTLKKLHTWFAGREPTMENEYTGMFEGKNLIWFTAEGFSRFAVDEELTPTLYKLANSGFVFENFYNALWWVSTSDGEYVATTSLIPKPGVWSMYVSGKNENSMYFCMGNQLRALGYGTRAYHNHTYSYYHRDVSHPNLGYDYKGLGNGLDVKPVWPESDLEMMEKTLPEYVGDEPFHTYYMTVSGHMNYNFIGNTQAYKHRKEVGREDHSEEYRAYLACQMELDKALEYTLNYLKETGHDKDTVICLSGDHYPYGMQQETLNEFNGGEPLDMRFDVYKSTLILWCGDMEEPVHVTKPCSSLDILPTLSNLFGLEYDSRLLMGRDILSDSPGLVVLSDRSYITDLGRYDSKADHFTANEGAEIPEGYVVDVLRQVNQMFSNSKLVLEQDYYGKIGLKH